MEVEEIYHRTQTTFYLPEIHTKNCIVQAKVAETISRMTLENMQAGFWRSISHYFYMKRWMISRRVLGERSKATTGMVPTRWRNTDASRSEQRRGSFGTSSSPAVCRDADDNNEHVHGFMQGSQLVDIVFHLNDVSGKFPSNRNHRLHVGIEKHRSEREGEEHEKPAERTLHAALEDFRPRRRRHVPVSGCRPHQSWRSGVQRGRSRLRSGVG